MITKSPLAGADLRAYEKLFQHPLSHNTEWRQVRTLLGKLGEVAEESNGHILITRNGHTLVLHRPHSKDITDIRELMEIRHFLERSENPAMPESLNGDVVVVISHHEARVLHFDHNGGTVQVVKSTEPRYFQHAADSKDFSRGEEIHSSSSYFEPLAASLKDASKILLVGSATGKANETQLFAAWLKTHHAELAARVIGSFKVDQKQSSDKALLAKARELFAKSTSAFG